MKTAISSSQHQKISGFTFCNDMENAVRNLNIKIEKDCKLKYINREANTLHFSNKIVKFDENNIAILCVDPGHLTTLLNNYPIRFPLSTIYTSICILYHIDYEIVLPPEIEICMKTEWNIICSKLYNENIVSCVLCNTESLSKKINTSVIETQPLILIKEVWRQVKNVSGLQEYESARICWGSEWNEKNNMWHLNQSSAAFSKDGIDFKISENLFACGMMNKRITPYASIEAACEVANIFSNMYFGKTKVYRSFNGYHMLFTWIIIVFFYILKI
jgi:hypothetical protein